MKYHMAAQEKINKAIEDHYVNRLKKCYESMDIEKQKSLKVCYLI